MNRKPTCDRTDTANVFKSTALRISNEPQYRRPWEQQLAHTWGAGEKGEWIAGLCKGCARSIDATPTTAEVLDTLIELPSTVCPECMTLVRDFYNGGLDAETPSASPTPKWDENCPDRLKPVILGEVRPPVIDWAAYDRVRAWSPEASPKGLALIGDEGSGKTTAMWALFRELESQGLAPILLGSLEMGRVLGTAARDIRDVGWMARCRVLMIDDLGKERASPGIASLFWEVLNERYNRNLPLIVSSRFKGEDFVARFGEPYLGEDIRRRMNSLCAPVMFSLQGQSAPK